MPFWFALTPQGARSLRVTAEMLSAGLRRDDQVILAAHGDGRRPGPPLRPVDLGPGRRARRGWRLVVGGAAWADGVPE
jgi:hypothetical protein